MIVMFLIPPVVFLLTFPSSISDIPDISYSAVNTASYCYVVPVEFINSKETCHG